MTILSVCSYRFAANLSSITSKQGENSADRRLIYVSKRKSSAAAWLFRLNRESLFWVTLMHCGILSSGQSSERGSNSCRLA